MAPKPDEFSINYFIIGKRQPNNTRLPRGDTVQELLEIIYQKNNIPCKVDELMAYFVNIPDTTIVSLTTVSSSLLTNVSPNTNAYRINLLNCVHLICYPQRSYRMPLMKGYRRGYRRMGCQSALCTC